MTTDHKTNFMRTSEFYLKITAQQHNAFNNEEILSLIFSERKSDNRSPVNAYQKSKFSMTNNAR